MADTHGFEPPFPPPRWDQRRQAGYPDVAAADAPPEPFHRGGAFAPPAYGSGPATPFRPAAGAGPRHSSGPAPTFGDSWGPESRPRAAEPAPRRTGRLDKNRWHWLLLIPIVVPLMPVLYNRIEPTLFGIPFFYWSQLAFAFLASGVIAFVNTKDR